jgi:succinate dehydrogenase / fumarate reductase flavoprotein subunit
LNVTEKSVCKRFRCNDSALITKLGAATVANKYGLFQMYEKIVDEEIHTLPQ